MLEYAYRATGTPVCHAALLTVVRLYAPVVRYISSVGTLTGKKDDGARSTSPGYERERSIITRARKKNKSTRDSARTRKINT